MAAWLEGDGERCRIVFRPILRAMSVVDVADRNDSTLVPCAASWTPPWTGGPIDRHLAASFTKEATREPTHIPRVELACSELLRRLPQIASSVADGAIPPIGPLGLE